MSPQIVILKNRSRGIYPRRERKIYPVKEIILIKKGLRKKDHTAWKTFTLKAFIHAAGTLKKADGLQHPFHPRAPGVSFLMEFNCSLGVDRSTCTICVSKNMVFTPSARVCDLFSPSSPRVLFISSYYFFRPRRTQPLCSTSRDEGNVLRQCALMFYRETR